MNLLRLTGLAKPPSKDKIGKEGMAALVLAAERMLRGGITLTPDFWAGCEDYEQEALALANDRLWASRIALIGLACSNIRGAAELAAVHDPSARDALQNIEELQRNNQAADRTLAMFGLGAK